jgi:hypothetical protein
MNDGIFDNGVFVAILLLGVLFVSMASTAKVGRQGNGLHKKFIALGTLVGKTEEEIINAVGAPSARSAMVNGSLLQWQATGYHIALIFDENSICKGISHEFVYRG